MLGKDVHRLTWMLAPVSQYRTFRQSSSSLHSGSLWWKQVSITSLLATRHGKQKRIHTEGDKVGEGTLG